MTQIELTPTALRTGKWKSYPAYKDSGVEWLGKIPVHWLIKPIKHIACFINGAPFKPSDWGEVGTPIIRIENLNGGNEFNRTTLKIDAKYYVEKGDLLFGWSGNRGTSFGPFIWDHEGAYYLNQHIFRLEDFIEDRKWFYWLLKGVTTYVESQAHGIIGLVHITKQDLGSIQAPIIPEKEQHAIATFLDYETAKINALIAKKEQIIGLLQEKRVALISHAVTKGLDPTVPMKDSGVEWLGKIPAHWEVKRLKFAASFFGGGTPFKENLEYWSGDIPWVSPKDMKAEIIHGAEDHITKEAIENSSTRLIQPGAVLIVVRSGILKHSIPVAINVRAVALNQDMKAIVPQNFLKPEYLASVIRGHQSALLVEWRKEGATVESIEYELLVNTSCPIPPLSEQHGIIDYLKSETTRIDALISRISEGIEKLKEYNTALISSAVTGKIDVRGEINLPHE